MTPGERARAAALALRMLPWALALPVLKRRMALPRLARLAASPRAAPRDPSRERVVVRAGWWASRVQVRRFPDNCLERSLLTYRHLGRAGAAPELHVGVRRHEDAIDGHAWVTVDGAAVQDPADWPGRFAPVTRFAPDGRRLGT